MDTWDWIATDIMYPHKVFAILYEHYHASFESRLCGDYGRLQQFWNQLEAVGCPRYNQHEIRTRANHKTHGIPIKIHGDGVVVTGCSRSWAKMVNAWTWSGLLASGSTIDNLWALAILYPLMVLNDAPGNAKRKTLERAYLVIPLALARGMADARFTWTSNSTSEALACRWILLRPLGKSAGHGFPRRGIWLRQLQV
jgi:hypothetical protein